MNAVERDLLIEMAEAIRFLVRHQEDSLLANRWGDGECPSRRLKRSIEALRDETSALDSKSGFVPGRPS